MLWNCRELDSDIETVLINELQKEGEVKLASDLPTPSLAQLLINFGNGDPPNLPLAHKPHNNVILVDSSCQVVGFDFYALGLATEVVEPEGFTHSVRCGEETLLRAMNFAARNVGTSYPPLRRYFIARYRDRVYASFGFTMEDAEDADYDAAATRIRGVGSVQRHSAEGCSLPRWKHA